MHQKVDAGLIYIDTSSSFDWRKVDICLKNVNTSMGVIGERLMYDRIMSTHWLFKRKCVDAISWYVDT